MLTYSEINITILLTILNQCINHTSGYGIKRVIRGMEVPCGEQPRIASLINSTNLQHLCGAILLSPTTALTAAHCVHYSKDQYLLQLNNYCDETNERYPTARILKVIPNDEYNVESRAHDISLLRIKLGMKNIMWLNNTILPSSSFGVSGECKIYGYGYQDLKTMESSKRLSEGILKIVSLDECTQKLGADVAPKYNSGMFCAVGDGFDSCQGDSGSPLICDGLVQGISSYGMSCGVSGIPGVYTSIGAHLNWILKIMQRQL